MPTLALLIALGCSAPNAAAFAHHIDRFAAVWRIPVGVAAAVLFSESTCRRSARGARGEVGGWQIRRSPITTGGIRYTDAQLMSPQISTWLAMRRLARAREACTEAGPYGDPELWVGGYAGYPCGPSPYGSRIVRRLEEALRKVANVQDDRFGIPGLTH